MITSLAHESRIYALIATVAALEYPTSDVRQLSADDLSAVAGAFVDRDLTQLVTANGRAYITAAHHAQVLDVLGELIRRFNLQRMVVAEMATELDLIDAAEVHHDDN